MADRYVKSTAAGDGSGSSWTNALVSMNAAEAVDTAGDNIYVSPSHNEISTAAAITLPSAGTLAALTRIICVDDSATPPTTASTGASITTQNNYPITANGGGYYRGLTFNCGTGGSSGAWFNLIATTTPVAIQHFDKCTFNHVSPHANNVMNVGFNSSSSVGSVLKLTDCAIKYTQAAQSIKVYYGRIEMEGGSIGSYSTTITPTAVVSTLVRGTALFSGVDLSGLGTGTNLVSTVPSGSKVVFRNCKLPSGWTGALVQSTSSFTGRAELYNCDSGATNYRLWIQDYAGSIREETTVVRTGGASYDGTNGLSWKMVSNGNASFPALPLVTSEIVDWIDTTGSQKTIEVEVLTDNVTLKQEDCWVEVQYLGTTGAPLGAFVSDAPSSPLATGTNQDASSATWTTTGIGTPVKQKLSVPFTPQMKGYVHVVVKLAKPNTTVYVCPKVTVV